jgi:hypothetical protein
MQASSPTMQATARVEIPSLPAADRERLAHLEGEIREGLATFLRVGRALSEIRERRLYRLLGYASFAAYTRERWDLGEARACQLIQSAAIACAISESGATLPERLSDQALRQFALILSERGPAAVAQAWAMVQSRADGQPLTGPSVRAILTAEGLPVYGAARRAPTRKRVEQIATQLEALRQRVARLRGAEPGVVGREAASQLAQTCRAMAAMLEELAEVGTDSAGGAASVRLAFGERCKCATPRPDGVGGCLTCGRDIPWRPTVRRG